VTAVIKGSHTFSVVATSSTNAKLDKSGPTPVVIRGIIVIVDAANGGVVDAGQEGHFDERSVCLGDLKVDGLVRTKEDCFNHRGV
jgi:hypothetical protein